MTDLHPDAVLSLIEGRHGDPFSILGPHLIHGQQVVRTFMPGASAVTLMSADAAARMELIHPAGLFAGATGVGPYRLRVDWNGTVEEAEDPYSFGALLGELDVHLLREGRHQDIGRCLGAHPMVVENVPGVRFAVWAPNARRVSVVGDYNAWDGRRHPMRLRHDAGVWELFIPRLRPGAVYKYELLDAQGHLLPMKADPVAWQAEPSPATGSVVADTARFVPPRALAGSGDLTNHPVAVYEVHARSWLRGDDDRVLGWEELGDKLIPYVKGMGFTHIEFLPVMAHPFGGSWGYQPLGQFAPQGSLGPPEHFARLVERCHDAGLGVILDWVPAHFPTDAHGLARFDGTALYEHADPREGFHQDWNTLIYNLGRVEVRNFLIGSALHWLEHYGVDALRVDAVASMLYRDYSRSHGEWVPNIHGGRENLESIAFLRELSEVIEARCPGKLLIAEESTAFPGVTRKARDGGLGFDFKWNMGWMNDTLRYMEHDPVYRRWDHGLMTFGLVYAFSEKFMLPISHDEVVHGKGSLPGKMPGDEWQRFANLRAYLGFMWTQPGKKLLFMGCEFAQLREWNHDRSLDWHLLDEPRHSGVQRMVRDLNRLYRAKPALHALDCDPAGFRWVVMDDADNSVFAWLRYGPGQSEPVLVVCNFTPVVRHGYKIGVPSGGTWQEIFNSDAGIYGGANVGNGGFAYADARPSHGFNASVALTLPPLATLIFDRA
ncbi:1,4-alpha-glucan branching protein GlgB [Roseomonas terrae]|jgi:1,4-alpha-glucan branching enzyme|uniref:1,4-alpha-glucan branching enzyme GlgB n=1 Tax=Neoroseomonas terrae TaxID=424799 RepID=A0ABS5ECR4_9PROT|nr:1,4-alpha-glucan branching protein GlgB [Neoroseomonas terrae]MBR0648804.1 1,4-alpha-glucan branching protein GlgB [Neoroseomonas terrae]